MTQELSSIQDWLEAAQKVEGPYDPAKILEACINAQRFVVSTEAFAASILLDVLDREIILCQRSDSIPLHVFNGSGLCKVLLFWGEVDWESAPRIPTTVQDFIITLARMNHRDPDMIVTPFNFADHIKSEIARIWEERTRPPTHDDGFD